jgi:polyketide cyclase/dehydrase/lipid transport protein
VLDDPLDLPRWWPSVYLSATQLRPAGPTGIGARVRLHTRGWLPYTLHWDLEVVKSDYPRGFAIAASGDFEGTGVWTLEQNGDHVDVTFDWRIDARKPLLRRWSIMLKPLFAANHRWAMRQGEISLRRELDRRRHG